MGFYDILLAKKLSGNGGGGGGGSDKITLLKTQDLGHIQYSSTSAGYVGDTTIQLSGLDEYDMLLLCVYNTDTPTSGYHKSTVSVIQLIASNSANISKENYAVNAYQNAKYGTGGNWGITSTNVGVYGGTPNGGNAKISYGNATIGILAKYNSTNTGTINGNYIAKVYGIKVYADLMA